MTCRRAPGTAPRPGAGPRARAPRRPGDRSTRVARGREAGPQAAACPEAAAGHGASARGAHRAGGQRALAPQPHRAGRTTRGGSSRSHAAGRERSCRPTFEQLERARLASRRVSARTRARGEVCRRHPGARTSRAANRRALAGRRARTRLQHHAGRGDRLGAALGERHARRKAGQDPPRIRPDRRSRGRGRALSQDLTYEQALEKLDEQLKLLEDGNLSLEAALKAVDDARIYLKVCTERLEAARKKIEVRGESEATE